MLTTLIASTDPARASLGPLIWTVVIMVTAVAVVGLARFGYETVRRRRLAQSGILDIDRQSGKVFEEYLELLFRRLGYRVERTRFVGDYGGDLVLRKDGVRTVVQAKRWSKPISIKAVQEAVAAKAVYDCSEAMVVSNRAYTKAATHLAAKNRVVLWDRAMLIRQLTMSGAKQSLEAQTEEHATQAAEPELATSAVCLTCERILTSGERAYCETNARRFAGEMLCFRHQRTARPVR